MALRSGHGNGAGSPRVEVLPADELPPGIAAPASGPDPAPLRVPRGPGGRLLPGQAARELARKGGHAKAAKVRQLRALEGLGIRGATPDWLAPYLTDALAFAACEVERLAKIVGGGTCGAAPSSMVQTAALQQAASRAAFARGDLKLGSQLGNDSRQNLLAAHELTAKEAVSRKKASPDNPVADLMGRLNGATNGAPPKGRTRVTTSNPQEIEAVRALLFAELDKLAGGAAPPSARIFAALALETFTSERLANALASRDQRSARTLEASARDSLKAARESAIAWRVLTRGAQTPHHVPPGEGQPRGEVRPQSGFRPPTPLVGGPPLSKPMTFTQISELATQPERAAELLVHVDALEAAERAKPKPSAKLLTRLATLRRGLQSRAGDSSKANA